MLGYRLLIVSYELDAILGARIKDSTAFTEWPWFSRSLMLTAVSSAIWNNRKLDKRRVMLNH